jgi:hypothetical protein
MSGAARRRVRTGYAMIDDGGHGKLPIDGH